jgi:hypothetical protein
LHPVFGLEDCRQHEDPAIAADLHQVTAPHRIADGVTSENAGGIWRIIFTLPQVWIPILSARMTMHAIGLLPGRKSFFSLLALGLLFAACGGGGGGATPPFPLHLERIDQGLSLSFPVFLTAPPGDAARLFVVEKGGKIKVVNKATGSLIGAFLDISTLVSAGGEQGLLGMAFDPQYANNGRFYVSYTDKTGIGNSVIARYLVSSDPNVAVSTADLVILTVMQPFANHNGGMIAFGPDGML